MKRPEVEEFKRLVSIPDLMWGMADCDVLELCDYILYLEDAMRSIQRGGRLLDGREHNEFPEAV